MHFEVVVKSSEYTKALSNKDDNNNDNQLKLDGVCACACGGCLHSFILNIAYCLQVYEGLEDFIQSKQILNSRKSKFKIQEYRRLMDVGPSITGSSCKLFIVHVCYGNKPIPTTL